MLRAKITSDNPPRRKKTEEKERIGSNKCHGFGWMAPKNYLLRPELSHNHFISEKIIPEVGFADPSFVQPRRCKTISLTPSLPHPSLTVASNLARYQLGLFRTLLTSDLCCGGRHPTTQLFNW